MVNAQAQPCAWPSLRRSLQDAAKRCFSVRSLLPMLLTAPSRRSCCPLRVALRICEYDGGVCTLTRSLRLRKIATQRTKTAGLALCATQCEQTGHTPQRTWPDFYSAERRTGFPLFRTMAALFAAAIWRAVSGTGNRCISCNRWGRCRIGSQ